MITIRRAAVFCFLVATAVLSPRVVRAESLSAAGFEWGLWVALTTPDGSGQVILHRHLDDEPNTLQQVTQLDGPLAPGGMAAGGDSLWIIHKNLAVYSIRVVSNPARPLVRYSPPAVRKALPPGLTVRSCAADRRRLWVLVGVGDVDVLERLDAAGADGATADEDTVTDDDSSAGSQTPALQAPEPVVVPGAAQDRLLHLRANRWVKVDLPPQWPHGAPCWMVMDGKVPRLVAMDTTQTGAALVIYRLGEEGWTQARYQFDGAHGVQPILLGSQIIVGRLETESPAVTV